MIPETPFFLSIVALSGSLAGLAGLVAGIRRSEGFRAVDRYRLRQIVEFAFANALLALSLFPLITLFDSVESAVRVGSAAAAVYLVAIAVVLLRRLQREEIRATAWFRVVVVLDVATIAGIVAGLVSGTIVAYEVLMLLLLARPMLAFLFVLASFDTGATGD
jgi:hypothetical protein